MFNRLPSLNKTLHKSLDTFYRFPFVLITAIAGTAIAIWLTELPWEERADYIHLSRIVYVCVLGIPLFISVKTLTESLRLSNLFKRFSGAVAALLLVAYYFTLPGEFTELQGHESFIRYSLYLLAFHFFVSFAPFLNNSSVNEFWAYNRILFYRILTSLLFTTVLYLGLVVAILSATHLLGFNFSDNIYYKLWLFLIGVFNTWFFLAGIPDPLQPDPEKMKYPGGLKIFVQYILIPLVVVYIAILYLYIGKIVIEWQWPTGWVANLVLSFSIAGIFAILLLHPIRNDEQNRWINLFSKSFYAALIPLVGLLALSIWRRVSEYGITVNRYFVMVLAIWLACIVIYFLVSRAKNIKVIPISLFLIALATSFGPWGAFDVSVNSQLNQFETVLDRNDRIDENLQVISSGDEISFEDRRQLSSIVNYLIRLRGVDELQPFFSQALEDILQDGDESVYSLSDQDAEKVVELMGFAYVPEWQLEEPAPSPNAISLFNTENQPILISGYDLYIESISFSRTTEERHLQTFGAGPEEWTVSFDFESNRLRVSNEYLGIEVETSLESFVDELSQQHDGGQRNQPILPPDRRSLLFENSDAKVMAVFRSISTQPHKDRLWSFRTDLYIRVK